MKPSYIEREAILCYLNDVWLNNTPNDSMSLYKRRLSTGYCDGLTDAMEAIREAPAADVRPVVRGKWETAMLDHERIGCRPTVHYCSECHQITWFRTFYCPNCGADMRGVIE